MEILRADRDGTVTLPSGHKVDAAMADVLGYVVMGGPAPTVEARAEAAAQVAAGRARAEVLRGPAPAPAPVPSTTTIPRPVERPARAPIPRPTGRTIVSRGAMGMAGMVELPCGRVESVEAATAAGYLVEGTPAAIAASADAKRDALADAVLSLPEATGRAAAARQLAAAGLDARIAARMLRGMPLDEGSSDEAPTADVRAEPVDPYQARLAARAAWLTGAPQPAPAVAAPAEAPARVAAIEATGARYRRTKGRA